MVMDRWKCVQLTMVRMVNTLLLKIFNVFVTQDNFSFVTGTLIEFLQCSLNVKKRRRSADDSEVKDLEENIDVKRAVKEHDLCIPVDCHNHSPWWQDYPKLPNLIRPIYRARLESKTSCVCV